MSRNNETSGVELVVVGVFAFCLAVVAWLMKTFDVEWQTALETAPGLIVWLLEGFESFSVNKSTTMQFGDANVCPACGK
ncbi:TPA: hypothetical protein GE537_14685 [Escherichia coli]|nr:hypothetical protein [Escherichia coli]